MIWWQAECKYGDMIRVCCGNLYHYGIFVSEDEVIQFGLPPVEGLLNRKFDEISVCVSAFADSRRNALSKQRKNCESADCLRTTERISL